MKVGRLSALEEKPVISAYKAHWVAEPVRRQWWCSNCGCQASYRGFWYTEDSFQLDSGDVDGRPRCFEH